MFFKLFCFTVSPPVRTQSSIMCCIRLACLQQSLLSFCSLSPGKCLPEIRHFISTASSLWPTSLLPQGQKIQQQRGCAQGKTSIQLRRTYMNWRTRMRITAMSLVGSKSDNSGSSPFYAIRPSFIRELVLSSLKAIRCVS